MYFSKENHPCCKQEYLAPCFSMSAELEFERILPANHTFQRVERLILFHTGLFRQLEGTHVSLEIYPVC